MPLHDQTLGLRAAVDDALDALVKLGFRYLNFPQWLEVRFEAETRKSRSHRIWFEGLVAIVGFNLCLVVDYFLINDITWLTIVRRTALVTPLSLLVNAIVRKNPPAWLREGSVAVGMFGICLINLIAEGHATTAPTLFGSICVLIAALFVGVVMRLRLAYVATSLTAMAIAGMASLATSPAITLPEAAVGSSMLFVGVGIIVIASHSLEREERKSYLLCLQRDLQAAQLASTNDALFQLSSLDKLTGLPNRRALEDRIALLWTSCATTGDTLSAIIIDVDHFKCVNDTSGHLFGDETLRRIGRLLPQALRARDDIAARFGGEEFILVLPHTRLEPAIQIAERIRNMVEIARFPTNPKDLTAATITVSCGVSSCSPRECDEWTRLFAAADEALYAAKNGGRNRVESHLCDPAAPHESPSPINTWDRDLPSDLPSTVNLPKPRPVTAYSCL